MSKFKTNPVTPETRLILQEWLASDYLLYNFFISKLNQQLKKMDSEILNHELNTLKKSNNLLKDKCKVELVDNNSLKGTPLHMAHEMVKGNIHKLCQLNL